MPTGTALSLLARVSKATGAWPHLGLLQVAMPEGGGYGTMVAAGVSRRKER